MITELPCIPSYRVTLLRASHLLSYVVVMLLFLIGAYGWGLDMFDDWQSGKIWEAQRSRNWYGARAADLDDNSQRVSAGSVVTFCSMRLGEILLQWKKVAKDGETGQQEEILHKVECTLYNRGDNGDMNEKLFHELFSHYQQKITDGTHAKKKRSNVPQKAAKMKTEAWKWETPQGVILLVAGISAKKGEPERMEYMRLVLLRDRHDIHDGGASDKETSHLRQSVAHEEDGTVWIKGIPMVDQGSKGYCVPGSVARIFAYYGMTSIDMHTLAAICDTKTSGGTSVGSMYAALKKIGRHFNVTIATLVEYWHKRGEHLEKYDRRLKREKLPPRQKKDAWILEIDPQLWSEVRGANKAEIQNWLNRVYSHIDRGIPLLWCVAASEMYCHKDLSIRGGCHMRLIIGYNKQEHTIIFSDSWGKGATRRQMDAKNAYAVTDGVYALRPK